MYSVDLYFETGFNTFNIPFSSTILENAVTSSYSAIPLLYNRGLAFIRIESDYNTVKNADYAKIGDVFYFVSSVTMENENTATLILIEDFVTTVGLSNIEFIGGWTERRHYTAEEDTIGKNLLSEPFLPQGSPNVVSFENIFGLSTTNKKIVLSSVMLGNSSGFSDALTFTENTNTVTIPKLPWVGGGTLDSTIFRMNPPNTVYRSTLPNTRAYDLDDPAIETGVATVRSLGIESALRGSYLIPENAVTFTPLGEGEDAPMIFYVDGLTGTYTNQYSFPNVENKKAAYLYGTAILQNVAGAATAEYKISEILTNGNLSFLWWCDPMPTGTIYARPTTYKGNTTNLFYGAVKGAKWQNSEILFTSPSGWSLTQAENSLSNRIASLNFGRDTEIMAKNFETGAFQKALGTTGEGIGGAISAYGSLTGVADYGLKSAQSVLSNQQFVDNYVYNTRRMQDEFLQNVLLNARKANEEWFNAEIVSPYGAGIQSYVSNSFDLIIQNLNSDDLLKFDTFLHRFGYSVNEPFNISFLQNKQKFNYIKVNDLICKGSFPQSDLQKVSTILSQGVRIWHVLPNNTALQIGGNPDAQ